MKKILYLGFAHNSNDPRLYYREISVLKKQGPCEIIWVSDRLDNDMELIDKKYSLRSNKNLLTKLFSRLSSLYKITKKDRPSIIQASDIRELPYVIFLKLFFRNVVYIYDSHEDYFSQILLFEKKKIKAKFYKFLEQQSLRIIDKVFCTDEYLCAYYRNYHSSVNLMRNYPNMNLLNGVKESYIDNETLAMVYIGTMNEHKGIHDVIDYVVKYNEEERSQNPLKIHIYTNTEVTTKLYLKKSKHVVYHQYQELKNLYESLKKYDIGVCLWRKHAKFERNLPIKNFDYMAVGLPVLTSNFGNLEHYIKISNSGLCIEPESYSEFKRAVKLLRDKSIRKEMGTNGKNFFQEEGGFEKEAQQYRKLIFS